MAVGGRGTAVLVGCGTDVFVGGIGEFVGGIGVFVAGTLIPGELPGGVVRTGIAVGVAVGIEVASGVGGARFAVGVGVFKEGALMGWLGSGVAVAFGLMAALEL